MHLSDENVTQWQFLYFAMKGIRILRQVNFITYMRVMSHNMTQRKYLNAMCGGEWKMWRDIQASTFSEIARNPNALRGRGIRSPTVHVQRSKHYHDTSLKQEIKDIHFQNDFRIFDRKLAVLKSHKLNILGWPFFTDTWLV